MTFQDGQLPEESRALNDEPDGPVVAFAPHADRLPWYRTTAIPTREVIAGERDTLINALRYREFSGLTAALAILIAGATPLLVAFRAGLLP